MLTKKTFYCILTGLVLMTGCGSTTDSNKETTTTTTEPSFIETTTKGDFQYKVINNMGEEIHTKVGNHEIYLYSDSKINKNDKSPHKGVVVNLNGKDSSLMSIQATYIGQDIVAKVYENKEVVSKSEVITVTDDEPVVLIEI